MMFLVPHPCFASAYALGQLCTGAMGFDSGFSSLANSGSANYAVQSASAGLETSCPPPALPGCQVYLTGDAAICSLNNE